MVVASPQPGAQRLGAIPSLEEAYEACRRETEAWAKTFKKMTGVTPRQHSG